MENQNEHLQTPIHHNLKNPNPSKQYSRTTKRTKTDNRLTKHPKTTQKKPCKIHNRNNVGIGGEEGVTHVAPPPNMVQPLMGELFTWLKETEEYLLIVSCIFHYEFEFIHPFSDGNGRVGRLWQSVILTHYKDIFEQIPIESVVRENQAEYYDALEASGSVGESTPFIEFMLDMILKTLKKLEEENQRVGIKVGEKVGINLTENQKEIIGYMMENPKISAKKLSELVGISSRKIEENIRKLKEEKIIERVGSNRGGYWKLKKY